MGDALCELLAVDDVEFAHASDADDLFSILETLEGCVQGAAPVMTCSSGCSREGGTNTVKLWIDVMNDRQHENDEGDQDDSVGPAQKRHKGSPASAAEEGSAKGSYVAVERNRRKQMSEHLAVLRSLMPCFYVKRGDQASIIGGVVDYIKELQQVLQSLEAKKHRMVCTDQVLSPRPASSPRLPLSPRLPVKSPPPLSPRLAVPISPRTPPTPGSPYRSRTTPPVSYVSPAMTPAHEPPQTASYLPTSLDAIAAKLSAYASNSTAAVLPDVKVEFAGANLVLKTISHRVPGQAVKIVAALEGRSLEILQASISTINDTMVSSFTIKIGIECELSAEELVQEVRQTFL